MLRWCFIVLIFQLYMLSCRTCHHSFHEGSRQTRPKRSLAYEGNVWQNAITLHEGDAPWSRKKWVELTGEGFMNLDVRTPLAILGYRMFPQTKLSNRSLSLQNVCGVFVVVSFGAWWGPLQNVCVQESLDWHSESLFLRKHFVVRMLLAASMAVKHFVVRFKGIGAIIL